VFIGSMNEGCADYCFCGEVLLLSVWVKESADGFGKI
jgi:hypothetical protein